MKRISIIILLLALNSCSDLDINQPGNLVPTTVDADSSLPSIGVNGTKLHAEAFGNPTHPMALFLHGGPGADYRNGLRTKELADYGYYVVFYDQRGSGLSKRHPKDSYTIDVMIQDVRAVIAHFRTSDQQKVFLIGHSWGGMLTAAVIDKYPDEIDGAVLAEPGGLTSESVEEYGSKTRTPALTGEALNDVMYLDQFISGGENDHEILDYKLNVISSTVFEENNIEGIEGPSPFWRNGAVVLNALMDIAATDGFDFTTNLKRYDKPVLFLYGEKNLAYGKVGAEQEAAHFKNATVTQIPDTGHEMFYFKWESVRPVILNYLDELK